MKKILVIIFFIVPIYIWAQNDTLLSFDNPSMRGKIISNEKNFSSSFVINTRFPSFGICNPEGSNIRICNPV